MKKLKKIGIKFKINNIVIKMGKTLVIVESHGKTKKIKSILEAEFGTGFDVMASAGHIMDLDPKKLSIDIKNNFEPQYAINSDKYDTVAKIKSAAGKASNILLATDKDREGEMIAWSLATVLKLADPKRITFDSITKTELVKSVKNPRSLDYSLIDAQKTRRELDRLVGYEISPILCNKLGNKLSAGRVQSVVVRILVDRESEIKQFNEAAAESSFKFVGTFIDAKNKKFVARLRESDDTDEESDSDGDAVDLKSADDARKLMGLLMKSQFKVSEVSEGERTQNPTAPFSTSTLQQQASTKLGMTIQRTMTAAQNLYECGHITYMRTDSINLSEDALKNIKKYVVDTYGEKYHKEKRYKTKAANTQEAHEAIRPTDASIDNVDGETNAKIGSDEKRLYKLIWKKTISSQMAAAKFKVLKIIISVSKTNDYCFESKIENLIFDGFLAVYGEKGEEDENTDVALDKNAVVKADNIVANQEFKKPPARYNEASLVNKLDPKNLNIGRPATYAPIIVKIQNRGYVKTSDIAGVERDALKILWNASTTKLVESTKKTVIGAEKKKLVPTQLGIQVTEYLVKNFPDIMDYKFTAAMEQELDEIARSKIQWVSVMKKFYDKFHPTVEKLKHADKEQREKRLIGVHPVTKYEIYAEVARYGPVVKLMDPNMKMPKMVKIVEPLKLETIGLDDAVKLLEYPKPIGLYKDKQVLLKLGRNGLYVECGDYKANTDNENIQLDDAIKLFEYPKTLGQYKDKQVLLKKGKNGLYIECGDCRINVADRENIQAEEAIKLVDERLSKVLFDKKEGARRYTVINGQHGLYVRVSTSKMEKNINLAQDTDVNNLTIQKLKELIMGKLKKKPLKK